MPLEIPVAGRRVAAAKQLTPGHARGDLAPGSGSVTSRQESGATSQDGDKVKSGFARFIQPRPEAQMGRGCFGSPTILRFAQRTPFSTPCASPATPPQTPITRGAFRRGDSLGNGWATKLHQFQSDTRGVSVNRQATLSLDFVQQAEHAASALF